LLQDTGARSHEENVEGCIWKHQDKGEVKMGDTGKKDKGKKEKQKKAKRSKKEKRQLKRDKKT
jgi:hypothetical protein